MTSRFPETIDFDPLSAEDCLKLLTSSLAKRKADIERKGKLLDLSCLQYPSGDFERSILDLFRSLSGVEGWASARDVKQLAKDIFRNVDLSSPSLKVEQDEVSEALNTMLLKRSKMEQDAAVTDWSLDLANLQLREGSRPPLPSQSNVSTKSQQEERTNKTDDVVSTEEPDQDKSACDGLGIRDAGVSDEVWEQLQQDWAEERRRETEYRELKEAQKSATDENRERIVRQLIEEEKRRKEEAAMKARLMALGRCPVGYHWIKQSGGYRCAGGSHYMSDGDINAL